MGAEKQLRLGNGCSGLMTPLRGRAGRYCRRIERARDLARLVVSKSVLPRGFKGEYDFVFGGTVYYLRRALRELAFASAVGSSEKLEAQSRFLTAHHHGASILNSLEASNPGAFPWAVCPKSLDGGRLSLSDFVDGLRYRTDQCLTPDFFMWSWRACQYSLTSLNVAAAWRSLSKSISPADVGNALINLLECHIVCLYRRGMAWVVIFPESYEKPAVIAVFDRGGEKIRSPFSRYWENGRLMTRSRYRESQEWPANYLHENE